jgi:hypothetical protein
MKKTIVLFSLLIMCVSIQAQFSLDEHVNTTYFLMKADLYKQRERADTLMEFPQWNPVQKDSTVISFNRDSIFVIENNDKDSYKLNKILEWSDGVDLDRDKWDGFIAVGKDKDGIMIKLTIMKYASGTILITVTYGNIEFRYQCRSYKRIQQPIA